MAGESAFTNYNMFNDQNVGIGTNAPSYNLGVTDGSILGINAVDPSQLLGIGGGNLSSQLYNPNTYGPQKPSSTPPPFNPAPQPQQQSSGGGGGNQSFGNWLRSHGYNDPNVINAATQNPSMLGSAYQNFLNENGGVPNQQDVMNQVNSAYGDVFNTLQGRENTLQAGKQNYLNAATAPYEALYPGFQQQLTSGQAQVGQQLGAEKTRQENAIQQAKTLFNELQQGVNQRFGGVGSTGEFANQFYGRQLGQNIGQIQNTGGQNIAALNTQAQKLTDTYNSNLNTLNAQKAAALADAQKAFQDRIDQIEGMKGQAAGQKAQYQLQALQGLRQQAFNIENSIQSLQNNLTLQHQSSLDNLRNMLVGYSTLAGSNVNMNPYSNLIYSTVGFPGQGSQNFGTNITGQYNPSRDFLNSPVGGNPLRQYGQ